MCKNIINFFGSISTIAYIVLTSIIILEMRAERKERMRPYLVANFVLKRLLAGYVIDFVIKNLGKGVAKDVSIKFNNEVFDIKGNNLNDLNFIKHIEILIPNQEVSHFVATKPRELVKDNNVDIITGILTYKDTKNKPYVFNLTYDINTYERIIVHDPKEEK